MGRVKQFFPSLTPWVPIPACYLRSYVGIPRAWYLLIHAEPYLRSFDVPSISASARSIARRVIQRVVNPRLVP